LIAFLFFDVLQDDVDDDGEEDDDGDAEMIDI
jgi:hypothetical protein